MQPIKPQFLIPVVCSVLLAVFTISQWDCHQPVSTPGSGLGAPIEALEEVIVQHADEFHISSPIPGFRLPFFEIEALTHTTAANHMSHALFIGDSRTIGLQESGQLSSASFFCLPGMSVHSVSQSVAAVPGVGKLSLEQLLKENHYDKVYIMLGINDLGCPLQETLAEYRGLICMIQREQPHAFIFLQANLHVTKAYSEQSPIINNQNLNAFNRQLADLANEKTIFYLDANSLFDDKTGAFAETKSTDGIHPKTRCCQEWAIWIMQRSRELLSQLQGV